MGITIVLYVLAEMLGIVIVKCVGIGTISM
jgi:hypothetical protein